MITSLIIECGLRYVALYARYSDLIHGKIRPGGHTLIYHAVTSLDGQVVSATGQYYIGGSTLLGYYTFCI